MAGKAGATRGLSAKTIKYFLENPGAYVRVEDLAFQFEATEPQTSAAVNYVIAQGKLPGLKAVQKGHVWQYEPQNGDGVERWAVMGRNADGVVVLSDAEGNIWVAKQAKF